MNRTTSVAIVLIGTTGVLGVTVAIWRSGIVAKHDEFAVSYSRTKDRALEPVLPTPKDTRIADPQPELPRFVGYLTVGSERWFALSIPTSDASKEQPELLTVGNRIGDFEISGFDASAEILLLKTSGGKHFKIGIADSKSSDSDEQLRKRWKNLIDTSPRVLRDLYEPIAVPRR